MRNLGNAQLGASFVISRKDAQNNLQYHQDDVIDDIHNQEGFKNKRKLAEIFLINLQLTIMSFTVTF